VAARQRGRDVIQQVLIVEQGVDLSQGRVPQLVPVGEQDLD
jgi:hypothetical protein